MNTFDWLQIGLFFAVLFALVKPLGAYMARVFNGEATFLSPVLKPVEGLIYRLTGADPGEEMTWKTYALATLAFNLVSVLVVYLAQRLQASLGLNPAQLGPVNPDLAFNTAVSFATNTNWQSYSGETTLSYLTQMAALGVQNFVSAATGLAVMVALIRGIARQKASGLGSFWVDLTRSVLYILLPLSLLLSMALVSQGVVQTCSPSIQARLLQPTQDAQGSPVTSQVIAVGPAASQVAIKQLGTNGGGFFNVNSAHPFENPTPFSNFLETLAILLIPGALCCTYGIMVSDTRQGWALLITMSVVLVAMLAVGQWAELQGNPALAGLPVDQVTGNMADKETRFGITGSVLWSTATTAASNGSVNAMLDSYTPIGGMAALWLILLGEVIFGGVGSGLYGLLAFVLIAVFVAGLMVGRTPEYLGKKIEIFEMKMAALIVLIPPLVVLLGTGLAVVTPMAKAAILNPGPHGFSEILYAFSSAGNNNGSAFGGLSANNLFYNITLALNMLIGRYWLAIPILAVAGSLAAKKKTPASAGTLPTHTPLFVFWTIGVVIIVGALSFLPALALGPVVENLMR